MARCKGCSLQVASAAVATEPLAQVISAAEVKGGKKRISVFRGLDGDDVRHPLDAQNTRLLRALPGLNFVAKSLMGMSDINTSFQSFVLRRCATTHDRSLAP